MTILPRSRRAGRVGRTNSRRDRTMRHRADRMSNRRGRTTTAAATRVSILAPTPALTPAAMRRITSMTPVAGTLAATLAEATSAGAAAIPEGTSRSGASRREVGPSGGSQCVNHCVVKHGPELADRVIGAVGPGPVGEQGHGQLLVRVNPERTAGIAEVSDGARSEIAARG